MQRLWRQIIVLFISVGFICTGILLLGSNPAKAQDDYTFSGETVNKGTSINPSYKNTEDGLYNQLKEGDQYTDTNYSGSTETMTYGTTGGGAFSTALDTDDATRRNYLEANLQSGTPYTTYLTPTSDTQAQFDSIYPAAATRLYMRDTSAAEPKPNIKQAATSINANHWLTSTLGGGQDGTGTIYPLDMSMTIGTTTSTITKTITEPGSAHYGWDKAFVSPPLAAQTISGTFSLSQDYQEASSTRNMNPHIYIYVWNAADTFKSALYAAATSTLEADTTLATQQTFTFASYTLTSTAVSTGDRIVIEMMFYDNNVLTSSSVHGFGFGNEVSTGYASYIEFSMTIAWQSGDPYAATHYDKLDDTGTASTGDGSATYIYTATTADVDIFAMSDMAAPGAGYNIDVTIYCVQRDIVSGTNNIQVGIRIGSTNYQGITVDPTLNTWTNSSSSAWTTNPSTVAEWTYTEVNALSTYLASSDASPAIYCTKVVLKIDVTYPADYEMQGTIVYNSVTSTSQTTGYQVLCQGYRSGSENFNVQTWNYTSGAWVTKVTINSASDTDFNFNLLGWATNCERSSGNVVQIRLIDATGSDTVQDTLYLDLLKIRRIEEGYALDVVISSTTVAQYGNITLRIKGYTTSEQFNVNVWNYTSSAYDTNKLSITSLSNTWQTTVDLCDAHHRSGTTVQIQFVDNMAASSDQVQDSLYLDVVWVTRYHTNPSLSQDGCNPAIVNLGATVHFWVIYTDYDNEAPSSGYPKVHIDSSDYTMTENGTDTAYWDGKTYHYDKSDLTSGNHNYYLIGKDANSVEVTTGTKQVSIHVSPTLTQNGVTPSTGNNGDSFTFFVTYSDADSDPASYVKAHIDSTDYDMTYNGTGGGYHYDKAMSGGAHTYYFKTKDTYSGEIVTSPTQDLDVNNPPVLSGFGRIPADPVYVTTELNFTCTFTDADNDLPSAIKWRENVGAIQNVTMLQVDSLDVTTTDGKDYYVTFNLGHGIHTYDYWASDGLGNADGGSNSITIQNRAPTIDNKFVDDHEWRNTYWEYDYAYTDLDGDTVVFQMSTNTSFLSINPASGLVYGTTSDLVGWYSATVWCNDSYSGNDSDSFALYVDNREPVITNGPGADVNQYRNIAWSYDFDFTDADGDSMNWARSGANWLTIASDGNLSGTTSDTPGNYAFTVYANDSYGGSDSYAFTLHVNNRVPIISSSGNTTQTEETYLAYHVLANDGDSDVLSYALSTNASWASISGAWVNGTAAGIGWYDFTVWANDSYDSDIEHWYLTVEAPVENLAPYFISDPIYVWPNNTGYEYDVNAVDPEEQPLYYDLFGGISDLGFCTINHNTGVITGEPHLVGDFSANVSVTDGVNTAWQNWSLHVYSNPPTIESSPIETWQNGTTYLYELLAYDVENEPLIWSLEGNCTAFLVINPATGNLSNVSGPITQMGWWYVNISIYDGYNTVWQNFTLTALNSAPYFTTSPVLIGTNGTAYYYHAEAYDNNSDVITFTLVDSPEWLFVDENTGEVEGTCTLPGDYAIYLKVSDGQNESWQNWTLTISEPLPPAPPAAPAPDMSGFTLLIMLGAIGFGAFVVFRRITEHGKPAKKPEDNQKEKKQ